MALSAEQQQILSKVRQFVCDTMSRNDPAHDAAHVERVVKLTLTLCGRYENVDLFGAQLLAWVHDLNDDKLESDVGAASVENLLCEVGTPKETVRFVLEGLPFISYRKYPKLGPQVPLEVRIVQDADRMDAMGAIGIARTFAYGGAKGRSLEDSLAHFDEKLLKLYDLLSTDAAREMAQSRRALLEEFYHQFHQEWGK